MHRYVGSCSPGQVHMLQSICDMVLLELQARGGVNSTALLRDVIARRVMSQFYDEIFKIDTAAEAVLLSFSAGGGEVMVPPTSKEVERALVPPETRPDRAENFSGAFQAPSRTRRGCLEPSQSGPFSPV